MSTISAAELIKILKDRNISVAIQDGQIGLPKNHNLPSEVLASIKLRKTEIIHLLSSPQINDTDSKPIERQASENSSSADMTPVTPEVSEDEFAQVVDVFQLLLAQEAKLRSTGQIGSIEYREIDVRTDEKEKGCSNS